MKFIFEDLFIGKNCDVLGGKTMRHKRQTSASVDVLSLAVALRLWPCDLQRPMGSWPLYGFQLHWSRYWTLREASPKALSERPWSNGSWLRMFVTSFLLIDLISGLKTDPQCVCSVLLLDVCCLLFVFGCYWLLLVVVVETLLIGQFQLQVSASIFYSPANGQIAFGASTQGFRMGNRSRCFIIIWNDDIFTSWLQHSIILASC